MEVLTHALNPPPTGRSYSPVVLSAPIPEALVAPPEEALDVFLTGVLREDRVHDVPEFLGGIA